VAVLSGGNLDPEMLAQYWGEKSTRQ